MSETVETARAKINLTLRVHGRRSDGYHQIDSLAAFAAIGDRITLRTSADSVSQRSRTGGQARLSVVGPFGDAIVGENLVERALVLVAEAAGQPIACDVMLEKNLPVASGVGGGSADAAAVLRAVRTTFPQIADRVDWSGVARRLGADVPVCFEGRSAMMTGSGETLNFVEVPQIDIVLANSCARVPADKTRRVFAALDAVAAGDVAEAAKPVLPDLDAVLAMVRTCGNDLACAAAAVMPEIMTVTEAVAASPGCRHALLSGAGPTIVGLYASSIEAAEAARWIARKHPGWWVRCSVVGGA